MQRKLEWFLFALVLVTSVYVLPRWGDWNVNSRMDAVRAVVERGTWAIDDYYTNTGDYAYFEGHFYSDKAPGSLFLAVPLYALFRGVGTRQLTDGLTTRIANNPVFASTLAADGNGLIAENVFVYAALIFITFLLVAVPSALLAVLMFRLMREWVPNQNIAFLLAMGYSVATPAFAYANNLLGHQMAAFLLVAAFYLLFQSGRGVRVTPYALLAGLALGTVVIVEYQTALIASAIAVYAIYKLRNGKLIIGMGIVGLPPILLAAFHNWSIFHTPLPVGYLYSPLYSDLHHIGFISLTYPKLDALAELMFGVHRGLFLISPFLLLCLPGFFFFARAVKWRAEFFVCLWSVASFWMFNSSSAMWQGGFAVGPRYLLPMLPFMVMPIPFVLERVRAVWARVGIGLLFFFSLLGVWILTLGGQEFPQYQTNPWFEYSLPHLWIGDVARNLGMLFNLRGVASLLPLILVLGILTVFYLWQQRRAHAHRIAQRLAEMPR